MKRIALIGECMIELNGSLFGDMHQSYGGDSLNTAVYMSRTLSESVEVNYVTALGNDAVSEGILERWQQEGVSTSMVLRDDSRQPGLYMIQLDEKGERSFLYWRDQSAARYLIQHQGFSKVASQLNQMDVVYLSGISLAILPPKDRFVLLDLLATLSAQGMQIAFDSNYRPALWGSIEEAQQCYKTLFSITDIALVTDDDEAALWGDQNAEETLARLHRLGVKQAVVKMGAKGNYFEDFVTNTRTFVAANKVKSVVDTTSAGDSFNAGYLAGVLCGHSPVKCSEQGHLLASQVIQHEGAIIAKSAMASIKFDHSLHYD